MRRAGTPAAQADGNAPPLGKALEFLRLLWAVDHGLQRSSKRMAVHVGVTGHQRLVLRIIGRFPGIVAGRIAAILHVHPSTLTGVLQRLERQRLISRRPDARDGRRFRLGLTPAGRTLDLRLEGTIEAVVEQVLERVDTHQLRAACQVLSLLADQLEGSGRAWPPAVENPVAQRYKRPTWFQLRLMSGRSRAAHRTLRACRNDA